MQLSASHESASPGMPSRPIAGPVASALSLGEQGGLLVDMLIDGPGSDDGRSPPDKTPETPQDPAKPDQPPHKPPAPDSKQRTQSRHIAGQTYSIQD